MTTAKTALKFNQFNNKLERDINRDHVRILKYAGVPVDVRKALDEIDRRRTELQRLKRAA